MRRVSVEQSFLWAQRFARAEWRLLVPVAFAFLALPLLLFELLAPQWMTVAVTPPPPGASAADLAARLSALPIALIILVLSFLGSLALTALALLPGLSVGEALVLAARRVGIAIAAAFLIMLALVGLVIVGSLVLTLAGLGLPVQQGLLLGLLAGVGLVLWVRLMPLLPVIAERGIGPIAAMRLSWNLTHGNFWRVLGTVALYLVGCTIVLLAIRTALGAVLLLLTRAIGAPDLGAVLLAILVRAVSALFSMGMALLIVAFYRQLSTPLRTD